MSNMRFVAWSVDVALARTRPERPRLLAPIDGVEPAEGLALNGGAE